MLRREFVQIVLEPLVGRHAHPRNRPAAEVAKLGPGTLAFHFGQRSATRVRGRDERANAGAADHIDGNIVCFEYPQNADVSDTSCESSAKRNANAWAAIFASVREGSQRANGPP